MHPPLPDVIREVNRLFCFPVFSLFDSFFCCAIISDQANEDDTIPLTHPIRTASGILVNEIFVAKGTFVRIPIAGVNKSETLWGPDAAKFNPSRWLLSDDESRSAMGKLEEIKGYKHILTFGSGPRTCLGKNFALLEVKVRCCCLIFSFQGPLLSVLTHLAGGLIHPRP